MVTFSKIYVPNDVIAQIRDFSPCLTSWNAKNHPDQLRLRTYLNDLRERVGEIPNGKKLFIDLRIDVQDKRRLTRHHDVENYLTPLFGREWFDHRQFPLVHGSKHIGDGSTLTIGTVSLVDISTLDNSWTHLSTNASKSPDSKEWKQSLNEFVENANPILMAAGQHLEFHMAFRCASRRNWVGLWKPTGDALSPILGYEGKNKYNPNDDRITSIAFHRFDDDSVGNDVHVGLWWRPKLS